MQFTAPDQVTERVSSGCYVSGLYLEGACWDLEQSCLKKSPPKVLIEELPILRVIPIEAHRLKLIVSPIHYLTVLYSCKVADSHFALTFYNSVGWLVHCTCDSANFVAKVLIKFITCASN